MTEPVTDTASCPNVEDLVVARVGRLEAVAGAAHPVRLLDGAGREVEAVTEFLRDLVAGRATAASAVSYAMALLRWWRFLAAVDVRWDRAERSEVRDFVLWIRAAAKPRASRVGGAPGSVNPLTGKAHPGRGYAPTTIDHNLTVIAAFYDFHAAMGRGPVRNPVPSAVSRTGGRVHAHHNWMEPFAVHRRADYRQKIPKRIPRGVSDAQFNDLFAAMSSHRDRAILAFYVSTGARASELLGVTTDRVDVGSQLIGVIRKGSQALQWLPASADAFVWLRLFQQELGGVVRPGEPVWWTLRQPRRALTYGAMRAVMLRANERLGGANWSLHDLRHTAAKRMLADPSLSLTDVQWVLGHAHVTTTQIYLEPSEEDVVRRVREHHRRMAEPRPAPPPTPPMGGYRAEVLDALLGVGHAG